MYQTKCGDPCLRKFPEDSILLIGDPPAEQSHGELDLDRMDLEKQIESLMPVREKERALLARKNQLQARISETVFKIANKEDIDSAQSNGNRLSDEIESMHREEASLLARYNQIKSEFANVGQNLLNLREGREVVFQQVKQAEAFIREQTEKQNFLLTNYELFCEEVAELNRAKHKLEYEHSKVLQHGRKLKEAGLRLEESNNAQHEDILRMEKNNKRLLLQMKDLRKEEQRIVIKIQQKKAELLRKAQQSQRRKQEGIAFGESLGIAEQKGKLLAVRNKNSALQKQLAFALRRNKHEQEQLEELQSQRQRAVLQLESLKESQPLFCEKVKQLAEEVQRNDLLLRKAIDRMQFAQDPRVCQLRLARNRVVERANLAFQ